MSRCVFVTGDGSFPHRYVETRLLEEGFTVGGCSEPEAIIVVCEKPCNPKIPRSKPRLVAGLGWGVVALVEAGLVKDYASYPIEARERLEKAGIAWAGFEPLQVGCVVTCGDLHYLTVFTRLVVDLLRALALHGICEPSLAYSVGDRLLERLL